MKYIFLDLEMNPVKREFKEVRKCCSREIIEFGAVMLDEKLNMDELESISGEISSFLDQYEDKMPDNYFLDVSTVGAERPIRNEKELMEALGEYIYVKTKDKEYYGTFTSYNNGVMNLKVKEKTREKDVSVNYQDTKKVRYAVKF